MASSVVLLDRNQNNFQTCIFEILFGTIFSFGVFGHFSGLQWPAKIIKITRITSFSGTSTMKGQFYMEENNKYLTKFWLTNKYRHQTFEKSFQIMIRHHMVLTIGQYLNVKAHLVFERFSYLISHMIWVTLLSHTVDFYTENELKIIWKWLKA